MYGYIYLVVNKVNGKTYVGQKKFRNNLNQDWKTDKIMAKKREVIAAYRLDNKGLSWNEFQKAYSHREDE